jgi:hypothetical protein
MTNTDVATASAYLAEADQLCVDFRDGALAMAQVQATIGVGHALLALVGCFYEGDVPLVPVNAERNSR